MSRNSLKNRIRKKRDDLARLLIEKETIQDEGLRNSEPFVLISVIVISTSLLNVIRRKIAISGMG